MADDKLLQDVIDVVREAGDEIMNIYQSDDFEIEVKTDDDNFVSPLTKADKAAHDIIESGLQKISGYPIISEEGNHSIGLESIEHRARSKEQGAVENEQRATSSGQGVSRRRFWLVDPLDGTKEFVKKNGEFTVNIALIENSQPILGVVLAPAKKLLYFADKQNGAFKIDEKGDKIAINSQFTGDKPRIIASRSHPDPRIGKLLEAVGDYEAMSMGSSLKLCLIAEGEAQIYPRLAPTMLWDTAAAHAVINIAGGRVRRLDGDELKYEPEKQMKNPFFVATTSNDTIFEDNQDILKEM